MDPLYEKALAQMVHRYNNPVNFDPDLPSQYPFKIVALYEFAETYTTLPEQWALYWE